MYFLVQFAFSLPLCTMCKLLYLENFLKKYPEQLEPTNLVLRVVKYFASENIQDTSEMSEWKVLDAKQYQVVDPKENRMCIWRGQTFQICPPRTNTNPNMTRKWHSAKIGNTFHPIDAAQCCIVEYSIHLKFFCRESAFISIHTWLLRWLYATQNNRISHHPFLWLRILGRVFISFMIWSKPLLGKCTKTASNCPSSSFVQSLRNFQSTS